MYEKTYKGVSLLQTNYFKLLCSTRGLRGTFDAIPEPEVPGMGETYTIALRGRDTYDVMQKVFSDANS